MTAARRLRVDPAGAADLAAAADTQEDVEVVVTPAALESWRAGALSAELADARGGRSIRMDLAGADAVLDTGAPVLVPAPAALSAFFAAAGIATSGPGADPADELLRPWVDRVLAGDPPEGAVRWVLRSGDDVLDEALLLPSPGGWFEATRVDTPDGPSVAFTALSMRRLVLATSAALIARVPLGAA